MSCLPVCNTNTGARSDDSIPAYIVWILVACVGSVLLVAVIIVVVILCVRRRRPDKRADSEPANDESVLLRLFLSVLPAPANV